MSTIKNTNTMKKVFNSLDNDSFIEMLSCFDNLIKWNYTELGGVNETIKSSDILIQLAMLRGFDYTIHELSNINAIGNKIEADINAKHFLNDKTGILTGTYVVEFNDQNKITSWAIKNSKLSGDVASFKEATIKVMQGNGKEVK